VALVVVERIIPVSMFVIVILAPGIAAPLGSVTVPNMLAVSWPYAAVPNRTTANISSKDIRHMGYVLIAKSNLRMFSSLGFSLS
jgi:hypothetical protein